MPDQRRARVDHFRIGGVRVAPVSMADMVALMREDCASHRRGALPRAVTVFDSNGQAISLYATDPGYARAMDAADLIHADGQFIVWLGRLLARQPIAERTATTDFIHAAAAAAAQEGLRFYLLGGSEDINRRCAEVLAARYPGLVLVGRRNGYFAPEDEAAVVADIRASGADIVWVGLGKPKEQMFAIRHRDAFGAAWVVTCGGCFHFVVGDYPRAPAWMQSIGLEWLHRMATGPSYLVRRYLVTIPHIVWLVILRDVIGRGRSRSVAGD